MRRKCPPPAAGILLGVARTIFLSTVLTNCSFVGNYVSRSKDCLARGFAV